MAQNPKPKSILDALGEEIIRIITPVSICMFLVVLLVTTINSPSSTSSDSDPSVTSIANIAYNENASDSPWDKFTGALINSLIFVAVITVVTFILVFLFYIRCTRFLKYYMGFSSLVVLGFMGGEIAVILLGKFGVGIDVVTFCVVLWNFTVVGVMAVFIDNMPISVVQSYLVVIGMLVAYWFTLLPEWTTWGLLVALALYDLAAVLLPGGPLRLLVELAMSRDEDIPALVYEARPVTYNEAVVRRRSWRPRGDNAQTSNAELLVPLVEQPMEIPATLRDGPDMGQSESWPLEGIGLGSSGAIKLGLGDFIFYSVLVGRAAMYDYMTVYACYLAIIAGLGITLMLLAIYQKALPALPVSILLATAHRREAPEMLYMLKLIKCKNMVRFQCREVCLLHFTEERVHCLYLKGMLLAFTNLNLDPKIENWFLLMNDVGIGYWPSTLFDMLDTSAEHTEWGGEVTTCEHCAHPRGSGHSPEEGFGKASYMRELLVIDNTNMTLREQKDLTPIVTEPIGIFSALSHPLLQ